MAEESSIKRNPYSPSCADGFTLIELLVALLVTGVLASAALSVTLSTRSLLTKDQGRSRVDQDLRIGLDLLGIDVRQAGERLPADFPAVELVNGDAGAPDVLIIRRNLLGEVLPICEDITSGTVTDEVRIAKDVDDPPQGCRPVLDGNTDGWPDNLEAWRAIRDAGGGEILAYAYNPVERWGEFIVYDGDGTDTEYIHKDDADPWQHTYQVNQQCRVYVIEERRYELNADVLQMLINEDVGAASRLLYGITDFQVRAVLSDGTIVDDLAADDDWADLSALDVSLSAETEVRGEPLGRSVTSRFFPRNVLSL